MKKISTDFNSLWVMLFWFSQIVITDLQKICLRMSTVGMLIQYTILYRTPMTISLDEVV